MNPVLEAIKNRKSVRSYKQDPVPRDIVDAIIDAGNQAPSRGMMVEGSIRFQPWRFVVVEDQEFRVKLIQTTLPIWKQSIEPMKDMQPEMYEDLMKQYKKH